ncbi:Ribulose-phosphate 3-epimerase [uncultured Clostridium sp.]|uniref:Ribulose-phosphate 3-epimerase n=1 Tax=Muricoprocola aceti TaxID=2981772 RepID=A0ABT2SNG6_9FIRM|nr:ribulose-phosphate 3-epimerase [Muricoprocola aceti]MCU6726058.1 ribulose-phosphate 3-epimerase [Muricoprocola aceti]SCH75735.1 Ribulose-phosphate 3-epimerase [uncultured Clostridium sp.]
MAKLSLSLFAADILQMNEDLQQTRSSGITSLHVDIMDGHFVPLFGLNPVWLKQIKKVYSIDQDFHFMAYMTKEMLDPYFSLEPVGITIHLEAGKKKENLEILQQIKEKGIRAGIAISPESEWKEIKPYLEEAEEILVMSTVPGREGSVFIESTYEKIRCIKHLITEQERNTMLSVDGGLNLERALDCIRNGADRIIMGRAFFGSSQKKELVKEIVDA